MAEKFHHPDTESDLADFGLEGITAASPRAFDIARAKGSSDSSILYGFFVGDAVFTGDFGGTSGSLGNSGASGNSSCSKSY